MNQIDFFNQKAALASAKSFEGYLEHLVIDARPPCLLTSAFRGNEWEKELFDLLTPAVKTVAGMGETAVRNIFITAPRGTSKTSIIAILLNFLLVYSKRKIKCYAAAADKDQARLIVERMQFESSHNQWLQKQLWFKRYDISGPTGHLEILSSDAPTSSGLLADLYICDEVSYWENRDLMDILFSGRDKRKNCIFIIISNAGIIGTWQHELWETAKKSPSWITHEVPAFSASWLDQANIEEQKTILPLAAYKRLHLNQWTAEGEDNAFVTREQLIPVLNGKESYGDREESHIISIDYGMSQDRTALCVCHADENGVVVLDKMDCWQGNQQAHVAIGRIEEWIAEQLQAFRCSKIVLDAFQLEGTAQKFEAHVVVERVTFGGNMLTKLAENLRSLILSKRIMLYPGAGPLPTKNKMEDLADELLDLQIVQKGNLWTWGHTSTGHDDRVVVLSLCALSLVKEHPNLPDIVILSDLEGSSDLEVEEQEEIVWKKPGLDLSCWR